MKCSKSLFSKSVNSIVIPGNWDYSGVNSIVSQIFNEFQDSKQNYSLRYDGTTDEDTYVESIDEFIDSILSEIPIELSEYDKNSIINQLRLQYYPQKTKISKSDDNIPIAAIIPETELKSQHEKNSQKLDSTLSDFFGTNTLLKEECKNQFKRDIFNATIIFKNGAKSRKVSNIESLNQNIEDFKNQLYKNIYNYLISRGITPELQITQMFIQDKDSPNRHKINQNYFKILDDFYLLLTQGNFQDQLEIEWTNKQTRNEKTPLLDAVNSYIQLLYFDELIQDSLDNYLYINNDQDQIILSDDEGGWIYKYTFGKSGQKGHKLYTEDIKDATKELGVFSKFLVENIPIKNSNSYMNLTEYFTAMLKLKDHLMNSSVDQSLKNAMLEFHNRPEESLKFIFESIMTQEGTIKENILKIFNEDLIDYKFNNNDVRIIESLYNYLYKGEESIYNIETKQLSREGFDSQYPILKTILGAFDSVSQMDYSEVVYDYDSGQYKIQIKKKYANKKEFYDLIDSINRKTRESGRKVVVDKYSPYFNEQQLNLNIGNINYSISPNGEVASSYGILNQSGNFKITITDQNRNILVNSNQHISTYFDFNLNTISSRQRLIDKENLSENEQQFMDMLSYIDDIIGTTFSKSEEGLQELNVYLNQFQSKETGLRRLFLGATKALIATKLHLDFQRSGEENFKDFLKEHYPFEVLSRKNLDRDIQKIYFYNTYRGEFLQGINKTKSDDWIEYLIESRRILNRESTKATTKNLFGDSIPNTSPAFLGREIQQVLNDEIQEKELGLPTQELLFNKKPESIVGVVIDTDARTNSGKIKQVASFSTSELLYHNFVNKFVIPMQRGRMLVQPTVYSDKKKFIVYDVNINSLLSDLLGRNLKNTYGITNKEFESLISKTIGQAYYNLYNKVFDDYEIIFGTRNESYINNSLRNMTSEQFISLAQSKNVTVMEDIHYRKDVNGGLSINELLQWYKDMYNNPILLHGRLIQEKYKFFNNITKTRTSFPESPILVQALNELNGKDWIDKGLLVIAKDKDGNNIFYGNIPEGATLNPLLENYFYSHILTANNLRFGLIGTELNHKVKALKGITKSLDTLFTKSQKSWIRKKAKLSDDLKINFADIKIALDSDTGYDEDGFYFKSKEAPEIFDIYERELYKVETAEQNAQLKRTVPVPGTMRYFLQDSLDGIASTMKCSVIEDIKAPVYQFSGKQDGDIDAHDGAAFIDPFTSILENLSLQDAEVGTIKKTLWHDFNSRYMSAELVKYAQHTITNQVMRQSEESDIRMYRMFKKMTDQQWDPNEIPDITNMAVHKLNSKINFSTDILKGGKLFYKMGDRSYRIENFGKDEIGYYTEEQVVLSDGIADEEYPKQKIYHFFGNNGEHYRVTNGQIPQNTHTINSLFELHAALGGIYSQSLMDDGELHYSEASNYAVANFMNNVCEEKSSNRVKKLREQGLSDDIIALKLGVSVNELNSLKGKKELSKTQTGYYQPLKTKLINYLLNQSSIKNGAQNINKNSVYKDDAPLRSFEMSTRRYGIQQDSDHEADEAKMTEFSQVISSLDAGGQYHDYVKEVYNVLGQVAIEASRVELDTVQKYLNKIAESENSNLTQEQRDKIKIDGFNILYDIIGKTLISNMSLGRGQAGLATSILYALKKEFSLSTDHTLDKFIIPLSDSNIYSQILQTFSSIINKKSIKREYPGNGMIMTPGYGIIQLWDIDDTTMQFEDILKQVKVVPRYGESLSDANRRTVREYLEQKQQEIPVSGNLVSGESGLLYFDNADSFYPTDNVNVHYKLNGENKVYTISLDTMQNYQIFIKNTDAFIKGILLAKGLYKATDTLEYIGLQKNITKSRDLAPARITYSYLDETGNEHKTNIFASYIYKDIYGNPNREQRQRIQKLLNNLDQGFIYLNEEDELNDIKTPIFNFDSKAAETVLSNIYQSKFGMNYYDSINDVKEESFSKPINISHSNIYDIALVKGNNQSLYISINSTTEKRLNSWKNLSKVEHTLPDGSKIHDVYVTEDNIRLFQVGREVIREGYTFDEGKYYNEKGEQVKGNFQYDGNNVWEYVEFVENSKAPLSNGRSFRFYNINKSKLSRVFKGTETEINNFIAKLIKDIYNSDSYEMIIPNMNIPTKKLPFISGIFYNLKNQTKENKDLSELFSDISGLLHGLKDSKEDSVNLRRKNIGKISYRTRLQNYRDLLTHKKYISFEKSQDFTSSRIPAQTLQSFMYMKCVGFTGVHTNQAYVSHFQTYLQGSDYDIDKSYMLGHEFDDNGIYLGWSSLFDYSSIDTLHASENLPYPRGRKYERGSDGINIQNYVDLINSSTGVEKINNIVKLLNFLNSQTNLHILYEGDNNILDLINQHESTYIAPINKVAVMKNFVSSHIQKQIQGIRNMMAAYSPIELSDINEAAEDTPKAHTASELSMLNPAMISIMQNQNMVGKNVVGIAANGQKANLMWNYFMNDVVRNEGHPYLEYAKFNFHTSRIIGRFNGSPQEFTINGLPDTNFDGTSESVQESFNSRLIPNITTDLLGSQYISAATDNAKELILWKINAGQSTAKCHLFLLSLGFDVKDIVKFMTSDAVSFIESVSQENIFTGYSNTLENVTDALINSIKGLRQRENSELFEDFLSDKTSEQKAELLADALEFKQILAGANEFSNLGKGLGINQGVPTTKESLVGWKRFFKQCIQQREKALGIINRNGEVVQSHELIPERVEFDFDQYLSNQEYREKLINYYDKIKVTSNIFAIFNYIPHFKAMFEMLGVVSIADQASLKSQLNNKYMEDANNMLVSVDDDVANRINSAIDVLLIQNYLQQKGLKFPIKESYQIFNSEGQKIRGNNTDLLLSGPETLKSFHYIFNNYVIPELQSGSFFIEQVTLNDGTVISPSEANDLIKNNTFIQGLTSGNDGNRPIYRLDIDMTNVDKSPLSKLKFQKYLDGFIDLNKIKINGYSLADWFMVYNLIINKNNYGRDRMTTLFQEIIKNSNNDYILQDYLEWIGNRDRDKNILEDIYNENTLQSILQSNAKVVRSYIGQRHMFVKIYDEAGEPHYYRNRRNGRTAYHIGDYEEVFNGVQEIPQESSYNRRQRIADNEEYGFGLLSSNYLHQILNNLKNKWATTISELLEKGYIQIINKCN